MTQKANRALLLTVGGALLSGGALAHCAAAATTDKSGYTLFDPTPPAQMRDFSTDRPDVTESAYTLDAGHFQVEMSLIEYVRDDEAGERFEQFVVAPSNLKVGLLNNLDLQFVIEPYIHQRLRADGQSDRADAFGATQIRAKLNLLGNDEGNIALAVMPFVQFPTADDEVGGVDDIEGGLIVPLAISLPDEWSLGMMAEIDALRNADDDGYGAAFVHTVTLGHPIAGELAGFIEYVGVASHDLGIGYAAQAGGGLTYALEENIQLDSAIYFGLSDDADDFTALVGLSFRM